MSERKVTTEAMMGVMDWLVGDKTKQSPPTKTWKELLVIADAIRDLIARAGEVDEFIRASIDLDTRLALLVDGGQLNPLDHRMIRFRAALSALTEGEEKK